MTTESLKIGQVVNYFQNGNHNGRVVKVGDNNYYTLIDPNNKAEVELHNAGYAVGAYIHISQISK